MILKFITAFAWIYSILAIGGIWAFSGRNMSEDDIENMAFWLFTGTFAWAWLIGYYIV